LQKYAANEISWWGIPSLLTWADPVYDNPGISLDDL
jgi:hypothetical protein